MIQKGGTFWEKLVLCRAVSGYFYYFFAVNSGLLSKKNLKDAENKRVKL